MNVTVNGSNLVPDGSRGVLIPGLHEVWSVAGYLVSVISFEDGSLHAIRSEHVTLEES